MKKITIELNTKSINEARKYLLNLKKQIPKMQQEFFMAVAKWIVKQADGYIDRSDIGSLVKEQIKGGWEYEPTASGVKIVNRTQKAVFVEFGVGIVGQSKSHPKATEQGYEYNMDSPYKDRKGSGTWLFKSQMENLDIPQDQAEFIKDEGDYVVITRGTKGVWYAYNAIVDAQMELAKSGGGEIGKMWEDIKARYIK
jgi:hypothetical protein